MSAAEVPAAVQCVYCPAPGEWRRLALPWTPELSLLDAARAAQAAGVFPADLDLVAAMAPGAVHLPWQIGLTGRTLAADALLHPGERVECWRALQVDPKAARHQRHARQLAAGVGAGVGAKRRGRAPLA